MKSKTLKILAFVLTAAMLVCSFPVATFAADEALPEGGYYGYIDDGYVAPVYLVKEGGPNKAGMLPSSFDGRTSGFTYTDVRNQNPYGTCWAHATIAAVETSLIRKGLADSSINLSELALAEANYSEARDALGLLAGDGTSLPEDSEYNCLSYGGNSRSAALTLNTWQGATNENVMNYVNDALYTIDENHVYTDDFRYGLDDAYLYRYFIINKVNRDLIKQAIMEYGIGLTSYYHYDGSTYYNSANYAYYQNVQVGTNHEISVIGWDDDFAVTNFQADHRPSNPGAWLVRNSWGTYFGNAGYFWISYEDTSLSANFDFIDAVSSDEWDYNYQYDGGKSLNMTYSSNDGGAVNVYTATSHQYLKAVSVSLMNVTNANYTVKVYVNPSKGMEFVATDTPVYTGTYTTDYAGIYTAELSTPVELQEGDTFAVLYKIDSVASGDIWYDFSASSNQAGYTVQTENIENDRSYRVYSSGRMIKSSGTYRIKAFTVDADIATPANLTATLADNVVTLNWNAVAGATAYEIYSATDLNEYALAATVTTNSATFNVTDDNGILLKYKVRAIGDGVVGKFCDGAAVRCYSTGLATALSVEDLTVGINETARLTATITPAKVNDIMVGYTVADESIAKVTPAGVVTGVSVGTTTVTAVSRNRAKTTTATITVTDGHECAGGAAVRENEVAASCTEGGSYESVVYCTICGAELSREAITVPATGHTPGNAVTENSVSASCTQGGSYDSVIYCTVCKAQISREAITVPATGHTPGNAVTENSVSASCTAKGSFETVVYCTVCKAQISRTPEETEMLAHLPGDEITENEVASSCMTDGSYDKVIRCRVCNGVLSSEHFDVPATGHSAAAAVNENIVEATCTAEGSYDEVIYCATCSAEIVRTPKTVEKKAHTPVVTKTAVAATCAQAGSTQEISCSVCHNVLTASEIIEATGVHTPATAVKENEVAATCTAEGSYDEVVYCTTCNAELSRTNKAVEKKAHTSVVTKEAVAATCSQAGSTQEISCSECNTVLTESTIIPATGVHTPAEAAKENEVAATCTEDGSYDLVTRCKDCNTVLDSDDVIVEKLGHIVEITTVYKAPTCIDDGCTMGQTCTRCGIAVMVSEVIPATGVHTAGNQVTENETASTCTVKGSFDTVVYCLICNEEISRVNTEKELLAHTSYESKAAVAATCSQAGSTAEISCKVCDTVLTASEIVPATNLHTAGAATKENYVAPTCTEYGRYEKVTKCSVCGYEMDRLTVLVVPAHKEGASVTENVIPASCTAKGSYETAVYCSVCGEELSRKTVATDKIAHKYENGSCTMCGEAKPVSADCSHLCHKSGFMGTIWKIINMFNKLFKINQYCSCGAAHW